MARYENWGFFSGTQLALAPCMKIQPCPPVEGRRPDRFRPLFCPFSDCPAHHRKGGRSPFVRRGSFRRQSNPRRSVPRFRCGECGRTFSKQTFACTYRLRRPELLQQVAGLLVAGAAHRQIARQLDCSKSTVARMAERIGRHAEQFHRSACRSIRIKEPISFDHFETFVRSQVERLAIGTAVGQKSWFVYDLSPAEYLRTAGRSLKKRPISRQLNRDIDRSVSRATERCVRRLSSLAPDGLHWITDDHPAYRRAFNPRLRDRASRIVRSVFPNPDRSTEEGRIKARTRDREMFPVDLLHKLLRHSQAHHRRETIAFGRHSDRVMERTWVFAVWRNFVKLVTERRPTQSTPAMRLGLTERRWTWPEILARRIFPSREGPVTN